MKKKILFFIVSILFINIDIYALTYGGCDYSSVSELKALIGNINISYDYHMSGSNVYFDITLNNIPENVYFVDTLSNITYTYSNTQNGELTIRDYTGVSGSYKFYSAISACQGISLGTKYYTFPTYNPYYTSDICSDIKEFSLCQKWANVKYSKDEFERLVYQYKYASNMEENNEIEYNKSILDNIIEFYLKYYYLVLGGIIIVFGGAIIIKMRKDRFKL